MGTGTVRRGRDRDMDVIKDSGMERDRARNRDRGIRTGTWTGIVAGT
jgi:hypothetical protein